MTNIIIYLLDTIKLINFSFISFVIKILNLILFIILLTYYIGKWFPIEMIALIDNGITDVYLEIVKELKIDDKIDNIIQVRISNLIQQSK